jgi:hypothetical protein
MTQRTTLFTRNERSLITVVPEFDPAGNVYNFFTLFENDCPPPKQKIPAKMLEASYSYIVQAEQLELFIYDPVGKATHFMQL